MPAGTKRRSDADRRETAPAKAPALREIYEGHLDYVWHSLRRLRIPEKDLADVTHDVFLAVARALSSFDPARPLRPWLFGIAFRVASDHQRVGRNAREELGHDLEPMATKASPEEAAMDAERRALLARCLDALDLKLRAVLVMHDFLGHSVEEISLSLEIPGKTVYSRLYTAREKFTELARSAVGPGARKETP
jgi:RNA polymerase sigma-70 factor (ECF subfamily)